MFAKEGPVADPNIPVEPEVEGRVPLEPQQLDVVFKNYIFGKRVTQIAHFRSLKDNRERYAVVMEDGACLLFAPAPNGADIVMTLVQDVREKPSA